MRKGCHWDTERGMTVIDKHPDARFIPTPEQAKHWMATGELPREKEDEAENDGAQQCGCEACETEIEGLHED